MLRLYCSPAHHRDHEDRTMTRDDTSCRAIIHPCAAPHPRQLERFGAPWGGLFRALLAKQPSKNPFGGRA